MNEWTFIVEPDPDGGYTARAVGENTFTQGETLEELNAMIQDAIECHFDAPALRPDRVSLVTFG